MKDILQVDRRELLIKRAIVHIKNDFDTVYSKLNLIRNYFRF